MTDGHAHGTGLSWLVVAHDDEEHLRRLLPALAAVRAAHAAAGLASELLVADNASRDGSAATAARLAPDASVLRLPANLGYGGGLMHAAAAARGEWLACANADLVPTAEGLAALPAVLTSVPAHCAAIGPALFDASGRNQPSVGRWPTLCSLVFGLLRRPEHRRTRPARSQRRGFVPWTTGACLFLRADALAAAGGFRPDYFVYYTEVDLAVRLRELGLVTLFEPSLKVGHAAPLHGRRRSARTAAHVREARRAYFRHHRPRWEGAVLSALEAAEPLLRRPAPMPAEAPAAGAATVLGSRRADAP